MDPDRKPSETTQPTTADALPDAFTASGTWRPLTSEALFQGRAEVVIRHNGRDYRLRRTRLGKLILTA